MYHPLSLFGLPMQLSDRERALSGICCQATWARRQQQPHYELSLRRDLASPQKEGENVQLPERRDTITKT